MPRFIAPDGTEKRVPGVYGKAEVQSSLVGPDPAFLVPILVGGADEGHPWNASSTLEANDENDLAVASPFVFRGTESACADYFGPDSDVTTAMRYAKIGGLPSAYVLCASALVRASVVVTSTGPINEAKLYARKYGAIGGHIKVKAAGGTALVITPPKRYSLLTADAASGDTRVYVKDSSWVSVGQTLEIGDNATANASKVVTAYGTEIDANGQESDWIEFSATVGAAIATADYGLVVLYDTQTESSAVFTTGQELVDWVNDTSKWLGCEKAATFTDATWITVAASTPLKEIATWGAVVEGESPAPVLANYQAIITALNATEWAAFAVKYQKYPQAYLIASGLATVHAEWVAYAAAERARGFAISVTSGPAWGTVVLDAGDSTDPLYLTAALDSQDFMLAGPGIDRLAPYLSLAAVYWGARVGGGVGHNLTNDGFRYKSIEAVWDEINSNELTRLHAAGFATIRLATSPPIRYVLSQGLSTLQSNDVAWNPAPSNTTCLVMQRDLADYLERAIIADMDGKQLGADEVSRLTLAAVAVRRIAREEKAGRMQKGSGHIDSITLADNGAGWNVAWGGKPPGTNDYIGVTTRIQVGD